MRVGNGNGRDGNRIAHASAAFLLRAVAFFGCSLPRSHLGVEFEQLFQPLGVVPEAAADVDALQHLVVALVRLAQVGGHGLGIVEIGDRRREMRLARQQDVLGAAGQVGFVLLGERGNGKGVPAEGIGVARNRSRIRTQTVAIQTNAGAKR